MSVVKFGKPDSVHVQNKEKEKGFIYNFANCSGYLKPGEYHKHQKLSPIMAETINQLVEQDYEFKTVHVHIAQSNQRDTWKWPVSRYPEDRSHTCYKW